MKRMIEQEAIEAFKSLNDFISMTKEDERPQVETASADTQNIEGYFLNIGDKKIWILKDNGSPSFVPRALQIIQDEEVETEASYYSKFLAVEYSTNLMALEHDQIVDDIKAFAGASVADIHLETVTNDEEIEVSGMELVFDGFALEGYQANNHSFIPANPLVYATGTNVEYKGLKLNDDGYPRFLFTATANGSADIHLKVLYVNGDQLQYISQDV